MNSTRRLDVDILDSKPKCGGILCTKRTSPLDDLLQAQVCLSIMMKHE